MVYDWKRSMPVTAQAVGEHFEQLENKFGEVTPKIVLDVSRDENALLHSCFEWNNDVTAEKYRETQAGYIIRNLVVKVSVDDVQEEQKSVREFVNIKTEEASTFMSIVKVMSDDDLRQQMLIAAKRELQSFKQKYAQLNELCDVFHAIESFERG